MGSMPEGGASKGDLEQGEATTPQSNVRSKRWHELRLYWVGRLAYLAARALFSTLRLTQINPEGMQIQGRGAILVTWHGRTLIPANLMRNRGYWALISLSRDGEIQNTIFRQLGFQTIRGSTGRGGVRGALAMARKVKEGGVLAFTPDGPRGPTHRVQAGVILMAEKSGAPIIPLGVSARRRRLLRSWDRYMIPMPFTRAFFIVGDPIYVPASLSDAQRAEFAVQVERAINCVEREAESRAGYPDYPAEWSCGS